MSSEKNNVTLFVSSDRVSSKKYNVPFSIRLPIWRKDIAITVATRNQLLGQDSIRGSS